MSAMKDNKSLRCYIASSPNSDSRQIQDLLMREGIKSYEKPLMTYPTTKFASIKDTIASSDFVFALISIENLSKNILFEIGVAYGLGKPVLILIQGEGPIPLELTNFVYIRSKADIDSIYFSLKQFLKKNNFAFEKSDFDKKTGIHNPLYKMRISPPLYDARTSESKKIEKIAKGIACYPGAGRFRIETLDIIKKSSGLLSKQNITGAEIITFLISIFEKEGAIVSHSGPNDNGADMALWLDSSANSLGNPILVEVKIGQITDSRLSSAEEQLRGYLNATNVQSGLLLYLDSEMKQFGRSIIETPLIIRLDIRDLVNKLESQSLARILLSERNAMMHLRG